MKSISFHTFDTATERIRELVYTAPQDFCVEFHHRYGAFVTNIVWHVDRGSPEVVVQAVTTDSVGERSVCSTLGEKITRWIRDYEQATGTVVTSIVTQHVNDAPNGMPNLGTYLTIDDPW